MTTATPAARRPRKSKATTWRQRDPALAAALDWQLARLAHATLPAFAQTKGQAADAGGAR